jgi:hypothetical protein
MMTNLPIRAIRTASHLRVYLLRLLVHAPMEKQIVGPWVVVLVTNTSSNNGGELFSIRYCQCEAGLPRDVIIPVAFQICLADPRAPPVSCSRKPVRGGAACQRASCCKAVFDFLKRDGGPRRAGAIAGGALARRTGVRQDAARATHQGALQHQVSLSHPGCRRGCTSSGTLGSAAARVGLCACVPVCEFMRV